MHEKYVDAGDRIYIGSANLTRNGLDEGCELGLVAAAADFEVTYAQYAEFQNRMEHYWCLRWLVQERVTEATATVLRENLVRFDSLPLVTRVADLPQLASDARARLSIGRVDLLAATFEVRYAGPAAD